jgi:cerevisin
MLSSSLSFVALSLVGAASSSPLSTSHNAVINNKPRWSLAPLEQGHHPHGSINDSYIVVFKNEVKSLHIDNHMNFLASAHGESSFGADINSGLRQVYDGHVRGYAGKFAPSTVNAIRAMPEVDYVEHDQIVHTQEVQKSAPWVSFHLCRVP